MNLKMYQKIFIQYAMILSMMTFLFSFNVHAFSIGEYQKKEVTFNIEIEQNSEVNGLLLKSSSTQEENMLEKYPRARGVKRDVSAFWYTLSVSSGVSILFRLLAFFPAAIAVVSLLVFTPIFNTPVFVSILFGSWFIFTGFDSLLAAWLSSVSFDTSSRYYKSSLAVSFWGHMAGYTLFTGVSALVFLFSTMLIHGVSTLGSFAAVADLTSLISIFTVVPFFSLPLLLFAWVAFPAVFGTLGTVLGAKAKKGFVIDPNWKSSNIINRVTGLDQIYSNQFTKSFMHFSLPQASFY